MIPAARRFFLYLIMGDDWGIFDLDIEVR